MRSIRRARTEITVGRATTTRDPRYRREIQSFTWGPVQVYALAPIYSSEPVESNRAPVVTGYDVYAPDLALCASDRVRIPGVPGEWQIDGEPALWQKPAFQTVFGGREGTVIRIKKAQG